MRASPGLVVFALVLLYLFGDCVRQSSKLLSEPHKEPPPTGISALELVQNPDAYKDRRIRVMLLTRSYRTNAAGIVWEYGNPRSPALIFQCNPPTGSQPLDIIGTCRGKFGHTVVVTDCTVNVLVTQPLPSRGAWAQP